MIQKRRNGIEGDQELDEPFLTLTKRDYEGLRKAWRSDGFVIGFAISSLFVMLVMLAITLIAR